VVSDCVQEFAHKLALSVKEFRQAGILAATAAREHVDLVIIAGPRSLAPIDRLHNDPRSRDVPVLLITSELEDEEARFKALAITEQVMDFPPEAEVLELRIQQLLADRGSPGGLRDYATARLEHEATALWVGRICWVEGDHLLLETDIELPEGTEGPLAGPALAQHGLSATWARVLAMDTSNLHYNYTVNLELELLQSPEGLVDGLRAEPHCQAERKSRLTLVADESTRLGMVAGAIDLARYSLRWVRHIDDLPRHVARMHPALILVDPEHEELQTPAKFAALRQLPDPAPPLVPLRPPADPERWQRLGESCPRLDPPPVEEGPAFAALVDDLVEIPEASTRPDRIYLKREHPYSHARLSVPAKLVELSEVAASVRFGYRVHAGGRVRLDVPDLQRQGLKPTYGRVLDTVRPDERAQVLWMGVGGETEARKLRGHIQGVIMEARRREYSKQQPEEQEEQE
jgi:hypothetical protein